MSSSNVSVTSSVDEKLETIQDDGNGFYDIETITQQANKTIVIHPGSLHLRIGRASDPQPAILPHVIAWRHTNPGMQKKFRMQYLRKHKTLNAEELKHLNLALHKYSGRHSDMLNEVQDSNKRKKSEKLKENCGWTWTDTTQKPSYLISDDALYIDKDDCYDLFWPIVNGRLNLTEKSLTAVIADLEAIWTKAIDNFLGIPIKEICDYRCILIIPDIYIRKHVKCILEMLFTQMQFASIIVHQEAVCATYGCGMANACVVDVGHHKTSISCIEDGFSHSDTRICIDIGGCDITSTFACLLKQSSFPYRKCDVADRMDALLLEELKETFCHLDFDRVGPEAQEFSLRRPGQSSLLYPITLGNEILQAPMSLFFPKIFGIQSEHLHIHFADKNPGDFSDPFDETYLASTRTKQEEAWANKREKAALAAKAEEKDEVCLTTGNSAEVMGREIADAGFVSSLIGLDEAIVWSIENCPESYEDEVKRRMYSCILLVGGGLANYTGVESFIHRRIIDLIPSSSTGMLNHVNVTTKPKGQDPSIMSWKGGTVLSSLDNAQELWIKKQDWINHGLRVLREHCPFVW